MESILNNNNTKYNSDLSVPLERVVAIRVKSNRNVKVGLPWSPAVVDFYNELFADLIDLDYSFDELEFLEEFEEF